MGDHAYTLLFLHLPKCGGTTLRRLMEQQYPEDRRLEAYPTLDSDKKRRTGEPVLPPALDRLSPSERSSMRLISGHFRFGIHESIDGPCRYITFFRHPVERVISLYYHARFHPEHVMHRVIHEGGLSLREILRSGVNDLEYSNNQTRMIAGIAPGTLTRIGETRVLERAKRNLDEHFVCIGLTERFDQSVILAAHRLGWHRPSYDVVNQTRRPRFRPEDEESVRKLIRERNQLDLELYRYARARVEEEWSRGMAGSRALLCVTEMRMRNVIRRLRRRLRRWSRMPARFLRSLGKWLGPS